MAIIYDANTNYQVTGTDLRVNPGFVTREYLIDVYPSLVDNFRFAVLWGWGYNIRGILGDNTTTAKSSPIQTIAAGTNWKSVATGTYLTAAIKTDGTLWLWGENDYGQLGTNDITHRSSPIQTVSGGTNWKQVSCGSGHTAAIKTDGTLWTWGNNVLYGQLGDNTTTSRSSPVQTVSGGTNWKQVSCGANHTAAIKTDGTLWLWGQGFNGQLGTSNNTNYSSPVQTVSGGTNWKQVSCGGSNTSAIKTDGTLWSWGLNANGQLGDNSSFPKSSPVQTISGGTNWKQVSISGPSTFAIKTDGTLWCWGQNNNGELADNTITHRSSPVQTISGGTNWKQVSCSVAIKTDGTLWIWGSNDGGQLGDNTTTHRSSPIQTVSGGTNWKFITNRSAFVFAIRDDSSDPFRAEPL